MRVLHRHRRAPAIAGIAQAGYLIRRFVVGLLERWYSLRAQHVLPQVVEAKPQEKPNDEKSEEEEKPETPVEPKLSGSITVGGHNLEDLDLRWWRAQIGLVQQEPFLFNDTICGNVANGLIGTQWESESEERRREMVQEACKEAYAHEFISRLPDVSRLPIFLALVAFVVLVSETHWTPSTGIRHTRR